jgi:large subunit ribosomal protein L18
MRFTNALSQGERSTDRPRLAIYRSLNHIYAQVIDDREGQTLVSASTTEKDLRGNTGGNLDAARRIGQAIAERAIAKGIEQVVFDRGVISIMEELRPHGCCERRPE